MNKAEIIRTIKEIADEELLEVSYNLDTGDYYSGYRNGQESGIEILRDTLVDIFKEAPTDTIEDQIETIYDWLCDKLRTDTQGVCKEFREKFMAK